MRCDRKLLSFYRDGELTLLQKREVDEHLTRCADCTAALRGYTRLAQTIRSLPVEPVPPFFAAELRGRIAERQAARLRPMGPLGGLARGLAPALAAIAVVVSALFVLRPWAAEQTRQPDIVSAPGVEQPVLGQPVEAGRPIMQVSQDDTTNPSSQVVRQDRLAGMPSSIARLYQASEPLRGQLGAPAEGSKTVNLLEQSFQGGLALWRGDTRQIYVLSRTGGTWSAHPDPLESGEATLVDATPPPGAMAPRGGIGALWSSHSEIQSGLGWAVYEPRGSGGAIQAFERGLIIWSPHGLLYVLSDDGKWKTYPDASPL